MTRQFDLFADAAQSNPSPIPASKTEQWREPELSLYQMRLILARARRKLPGLPPLIRAAYSLTVNAYRNKFRYDFRNMILGVPDRTFRWTVICPTMPETVMEQLLQCETTDLPGVEIRRHHQPLLNETAIHVPDVGTLELRRWTINEYASVSYAPYRTPRLLPRYSDDRPRIALPSAMWEHTCNAQKIGEADGKMAEVHTVRHGGREYAVTNTWSCAGIQDAAAWSIAPRSGWNGPVYTYQELRRAWDAGEIERGNERGLLVKVRGEPCVLESLSFFHDDQSGKCPLHQES